jgi:cell division protein FtsB
MDKKAKVILGVASAVVVLVIGFLLYTMHEQMVESKQMQELAEMDKLEMENEYEQFAMQYNEMKAQINNDSLVAQLEIEQKRTEELLEELRRVKSNDAAEIMRLKKELATLREVLRSYVLQIDSLNRMNEALTQENSNLKTQNEQARQHISNLSSENESLSDKVAIASQLDATGIYAVGRNKKGKAASKIKDVKKFVIGFTIARNVTTSTGIRSLYVRITTPTGDVLTKGGTFAYENRQLEYSIRKDIEYTGEEQSVTVYWDVAEALSAGNYRVDIFADGQNIGTTHFSFDK